MCRTSGDQYRRCVQKLRDEIKGISKVKQRCPQLFNEDVVYDKDYVEAVLQETDAVKKAAKNVLKAIEQLEEACRKDRSGQCAGNC